MSIYTAEIDRELNSFCERFGLHVHTKYKDEEVRSIDIVDDQGKSYQLWLELDEGEFVINIWDKRKNKQRIPVVNYDYKSALDKSYEQITSWMAALGRSRAIVR